MIKHVLEFKDLNENDLNIGPTKDLKDLNLVPKEHEGPHEILVSMIQRDIKYGNDAIKEGDYEYAYSALEEAKHNLEKLMKAIEKLAWPD